jgi:hypothetical protein
LGRTGRFDESSAVGCAAGTVPRLTTVTPSPTADQWPPPRGLFRRRRAAARPASNIDSEFQFSECDSTCRLVAVTVTLRLTGMLPPRPPGVSDWIQVHWNLKTFQSLSDAAECLADVSKVLVHQPSASAWCERLYRGIPAPAAVGRGTGTIY